MDFKKLRKSLNHSQPTPAYDIALLGRFSDQLVSSIIGCKRSRRPNNIWSSTCVAFVGRAEYPSFPGTRNLCGGIGLPFLRLSQRYRRATTCFFTTLWFYSKIEFNATLMRQCKHWYTIHRIEVGYNRDKKKTLLS